MNKNWLAVLGLIILLGIGIGVYLIIKNASNGVLNNSYYPGMNSSSEGNSSQNEIDISNFAFNPSTITINSGDTVIWKNLDAISHTITSDSGSELNATSISNGQTYSHTFNTAGTYNYHCSIHISMKGTIVVK